jgi:hypothetical protein
MVWHHKLLTEHVVISQLMETQMKLLAQTVQSLAMTGNYVHSKYHATESMQLMLWAGSISGSVVCRTV